MKPILAAAAILALATPVIADENITTPPNIFAFKYAGPTYLTIPGQVAINLQDGSLKYEPDYSPDAAARQFWEAMSQEYRDMLRWKAEHPQ